MVAPIASPILSLGRIAWTCPIGAGFTHVQQLTVTSTATGAILSFNNEQLVVDSANGLSLSATDFTNANVIALPQTDLSATLAAETNFTVSHQALTTGLTGQHNWAVQTHTAAAVYAAQQVAGQTAATASSDSFVFVPQGMPLATELEATIDTLALQNIQGGSMRALTKRPLLAPRKPPSSAPPQNFASPIMTPQTSISLYFFRAKDRWRGS